MTDQQIKQLLALALAIKAGATTGAIMTSSVRLYQQLFLTDWNSPLVDDLPCQQDQEIGKNPLQDCSLATSFRALQKESRDSEADKRTLSTQERSELLTLVGTILSS